MADRAVHIVATEALRRLPISVSASTVSAGVAHRVPYSPSTQAITTRRGSCRGFSSASRSRKAEAASDDDLLRSLLSDDGGDFDEDEEDESFASFLGSDEDDLEGEDEELLSILGIGGGDAPDAVPVATTESYDAMKVPELKALLKERGLKVGGKKAELVARLREAA